MQFNDFPLILAGPILRRVEPSRAFIWLATSKRIEIKARIYEITNHQENHLNYEKISTKSETKSIKMGENLFIHLVKVSPKSGNFSKDILLGYNLKFKSGSKQHDLESLEFLSPDNPASIVYGNLKYPTFQLKSDYAASNILYGSCRKLHGDGEDTLALADALIKKDQLNLQNRPDALFLMGDQIYADDVADPIFRAITTLSEQLIGQRETLEFIEPRLKEKPYSTSLRQFNGRKYILETFCQFTSSESQNHLMEVGEFAAMYLLSWGPQAWQSAQANDLFQSFQEASENRHVHFSFPNNERYKKEHMAEQSKLKNRYVHHEEMLISFQQSLPKVRRLLANIPTYMIFDDHDITDDWNISENWKKNVQASPLGRHVVANGLAAYWAFQGWGNDPDSFNDQFLWEMTSHFEKIRSGEMYNCDNWAKTLWEFDSWQFVSPTTPKAIFLDARTKRDYNSPPKPVKFGSIIEENRNPPKLLSSDGWVQASAKLQASGWKKNTPLIIVAPTPVYGMGLIESFLHDYVYPLKVLGVEVQTTFDFEAWKYNSEGFTDFLQNTADWAPNPCIILSGDVHYASAVKAKVTFKDQRELTINQFTSSPFKNMSFSGIWGLLMKMVICLNVRNRKNRDISRYCSPDFEIIQDEKDDKTMEPDYLWKDKLRYQFLEQDTIIETNNNLGFLTITPDKLTNSLITKNPSE